MLKLNFKFKTIFLVILLLASYIVMPISLYSVNAQGSEDYTVNSYDIDVKVSEDNVLYVTETIKANFFVEKHGIFRNIPVVLSPTWLDDGKQVSKKYRVQLSDVSVTNESGVPYSFEGGREGNDYVIKIGDEDITLKGTNVYVVKYSYDIGNDKLPQYDQLYYNLIGDGWGTTIRNVSFSVEMPKEFDKENLGFSLGEKGSFGTTDVKFNVNEKLITGTVERALQPYEALTLRLQLPEGYFSKVEVDNYYWLIALCAIFIVVSIILFQTFGRDDKVYTTVEVTPPDDITSAEAGYIIDGNVDDRDVLSLIIYWADKGYITISNDSNDNFILNRIKPSDRNMRDYEAFMFDEMFREKDAISKDDLKYKFHDTLAKVKGGIPLTFKDESRTLYTSKSKTVKGLCYIFAGICMALLVGVSISIYEFSSAAGLVSGIVGFVATITLASIVGHYVDVSASGKKAGLVVSTLIYILVISIVTMIAINYTEIKYAFFACGFAAIVCGIVGSYSKKRTPQSNKWLGKLLGLKKFITLTEKDRIELLVHDNPQLFYNILPYAYALDVTDEWAKQFESITIEPPTWYYGDINVFTAIYFTSLMNRNMESYGANMNSVEPSSSSGGSGGFSGGGFSGGGFGGGGGGSW